MGAVSSVAWSPNSIYLSSAGLDGAVHSWYMDGFQRYAECVTTGSQYSDVLYDANRKYVYACGPNLPLRAIETEKNAANLQFVPEKNLDDESHVEPDTEDDQTSASRWEHHIFRSFDQSSICTILVTSKKSQTPSKQSGHVLECYASGDPLERL
jgi:WD40 repeat protein